MFQDTFCSGPWFHVKLTYDGSFRMCRWGQEQRDSQTPTLNTHSIVEFYNSSKLKKLRQDLLAGEQPEHCGACYYEQSHSKLTGRHRQLNKSAVDVNNFALTMRSSPHYNNFKFSLDNNGQANMQPVDLQIDLGNTCNSACIMCQPIASSRLGKDYIKLNKLDPVLFDDIAQYTPWTKNAELVESVVEQIGKIGNLKYIHFLGGETLYDETFYHICDELIRAGIAKNIIVGTTTNGTIYNDRLQHYIKNFKEFHLGISIESVTALNDYIRYPSDVKTVLHNTKQLLELRLSNPGLYVSLRITPNIFSIYELDQLFEYMIEHQVIAESCNILFDPKQLRMELLPDDIRQDIKSKFEFIINKYNLSKSSIVNVRRSDLIPQVTANVILDYYQFICTYQPPTDIEESRYELVKFLKAFETIRHNSIIDYAPRYEKFLRAYGY